MPVQIGAKVHNFTDPTRLLSDCHRRIEIFLGMLQAVAELIDRPPGEEVIRPLASALRYFSEAGPKHNADEEESLFPRLHRMQISEIQPVLRKLHKLEEEHRWAAPVHAKVKRLGEQYISAGQLSASEVDAFRSHVALLAMMYEQHIEIEDRTVFPLADQVLSASDKSAIASEMAQRRGVTIVTNREILA
jgi:hemerythrin-like domain-containing protein